VLVLSSIAEMGDRLATIHQRHRQTDTQTGQDRQDNGPIPLGEPFYKRSPKVITN